jgi:hypothetical protein
MQAKKKWQIEAAFFISSFVPLPMNKKLSFSHQRYGFYSSSPVPKLALYV